MSSWTTRRSEDGGPARSNLSHANNSQSQKQQPGHSTSGSGLLSFLKTELDSFVKGLSGKPDSTEETPIRSTPNPPRKKLKRSHEAHPEHLTYADVKAYERELEEIRQHTSKRYTKQEYYAPLTEANLQASSSRLKSADIQITSPIKISKRSEDLQTAVEAYSSYYTEAPVPQIPSSYANESAPHSQTIENRRRKRERAATFVHDEEARQIVARQIAEEEARLKAAEIRATEHRRQRERDAREAKRKQDRAEALARLEAQELREQADQRYLVDQREAEEHKARKLQAYKERLNQEQERAEDVRRQRKAHEEEHRRHVRKEAQEKLEQAQSEAEKRSQYESAQKKAHALEEAANKARKDEEEDYRRQQHRQHARRTRDLEIAEKERTEALRNEGESKRIKELEAEVQTLRRELQEAKRKQEEAANFSLNASRHVHFAPTPPGSDGHYGAEQSFLSLASTSSSSLGTSASRRVVPPPPPPPPPPPSLIPKAARATPLTLLAAHKANCKSDVPDSQQKKKVPRHSTGPGMPADMAKFLAEMRTTKLKKVGMPVEGAKKPRDDEETGLKSILENVLKKRFLGDRTSGSTRTSSMQTVENDDNHRLSMSTNSSITSFSSYRPPDWSMEMDSSPFPPPRSASLPKHTARLNQTTSVTSSAVAGPSTSTLLPQSMLSRTRSQPDFPKTSHRSQALALGSGLVRSQSLAQVETVPRPSYGQAITSEQPAEASRQKTQVYTKAHHRQSSNMTPLPRPEEDDTYVSHAVEDRTSTSVQRESRSRQMSDKSMTRRSVRSVGSSFDIDMYMQMQLQEENDSLEEETRRSFSNPPAVDGAMDFASPPAAPRSAKQSQESVEAAERIKTRSHYQIPELKFRQPAFSFSPEKALQGARTDQASGRKVSYYTQPRPAPYPHEEVLDGPKEDAMVDALGRPLSPSKSRARQQSSRIPFGSLPPQQNVEEDDDDSVLLPYLAEEQADMLLREEEAVFSGYGTGTRRA